MFKSIYFKTEFKKIFREPIMALLFLAPILMAVIFRLLILFAVPFLQKYISFDFSAAEPYVLSFVFVINAMLLSIVTGFSMIDDKDNRIAELMSITPMGIDGYLVIRFALVFASVIIYTFYTYAVLHIFIIPLYVVLLVSVILCFYSAVMGYVLFLVASDKVNGLTYAKGLNIVMLFMFTDLLNIKWLNGLSWAFPPYWIEQAVKYPENPFNICFGALVTMLWFLALWAVQKRKQSF